MTGVLVVMVMIVVSGLSPGQAQLNVDLSKATKDPATGNYCVMQKVGDIQRLLDSNIYIRQSIF